MKVTVFATFTDSVGNTYELKPDTHPTVGQFGELILYTTAGLRIFADGSWSWLMEVL